MAGRSVRSSRRTRSSLRSTTGNTWPILATSLDLARRGDGSLLLQIADPYQGRNPNGSYSNQHDAYTANTCLDFAAPTDVATYTAWAKGLEASAPHFAGLIAYNDLACAFWPVPAQRTPAAVTAAGAPPIVVVGTTGDPATPYAWAEGPGRRAGFGGAGHPRRARATRRTSRARACSARSTSTCSG